MDKEAAVAAAVRQTEEDAPLNIVQQDIERLRISNQQRDNKLKMTFDQFQIMTKQIVQIVNMLVKPQEGENLEEAGLREIEGITLTNIFEKYAERNMEIIQNEADTQKLKRVITAVVRRLTVQENVLVCTSEDAHDSLNSKYMVNPNMDHALDL